MCFHNSGILFRYSRESQVHSAQSFKRCGSIEPNPTCAGPSPYRNRCLNSQVGVRSQCGSVTCRSEGARQRYSGRCHDSASMVRQPPNMGEALGCNYTLFRWKDGYQRETMGVLGDIAWRKWCSVLTDEVLRGSRSGISSGYKATPKCLDYAMVSTGLSPTLVLQGLQRVRRRLANGLPKGHTCVRVGNGCNRKGIVNPGVGDHVGLPSAFSGRASGMLKTPSTSLQTGPSGITTLGGQRTVVALPYWGNLSGGRPVRESRTPVNIGN